MKGTGAKRNVCPGSCVTTGAKFPVAPVESAPMDVRLMIVLQCTLFIMETYYYGPLRTSASSIAPRVYVDPPA